MLERASRAHSSSSYSWDDIGRLTGQANDLNDSSNDVSFAFTLNPASQIASEARTESNNKYAYDGLAGVNRNYSVNGLNQYTTAGNANFTYDANGNLTGDGTSTFTYDVENRLVKAVAGGQTTNLTYDALGRLFQTDKGTSGSTTKFLYDADALVAEFGNSNSLIARYVHGSNPAADDPLVWYTTTNLGSKRYLHADHLGSIIAAASANGSAQVINAYDEYGIPDSDNEGRFQFTGQAWIPELGMYYYKARIYSPTLGRFMQTDPIGYDDQVNLYAYVGNDPVNAVDMFGLCPKGEGSVTPGPGGEIVITCPRDNMPVDVSRQQAAYSPGMENNRPKEPQNDKPASPPQPDWCGSDELNVPDGNWGGACRNHDICYATPGQNKESCDSQLIVDIYFECTGRSPRGTAPACALIGFTYGVGLMIGGFEARQCGAGGCGPTFVGPSRRAFNRAQRRN